MIEEIKMLSIFSNEETINKELTVKELANLFGMKEEVVNNVLLFKENKSKMTISEFIGGINVIKSKTSYLDNYEIKNTSRGC